MLDEFGEEGCALEDALEQIFADLKRRGIAVETVNLAASHSKADAQVSFGMMYTNGEGDWQDDYAQKTLCYRKAAEQGDARAQFNLGVLYYMGNGVAQDFAKAYFWFNLATAAEQDASLMEQSTKYRATRCRGEAASHLAPADLSREQERARKWFEDHAAKP
jgi:hypothetical protein